MPAATQEDPLLTCPEDSKDGYTHGARHPTPQSCLTETEGGQRPSEDTKASFLQDTYCSRPLFHVHGPS